MKRRPPLHALLGPRALANDVAVAYSFHHSDVAWMWFRSPLVLDPDFFGPQKLQCHNVALVVAAVVMVPTQTEHPRRIVARREMKIPPVDVGERRRSRERSYPAENAGLCSPRSPQL